MHDVNVTPSERGFLHSDLVETTYGAVVNFSESSAAMHPRIWMWANQPEPEYPGGIRPELGHVSVHMSVPQAEQIRDALDYFIKKAREDWGELDGEGDPVYDEENENA